jgi:hypothetical protein
MESTTDSITESEKTEWILNNTQEIKSSEIVFDNDICEISVKHYCELKNIPPFKIKFKGRGAVNITIDYIKNLDWMDKIDVSEIEHIKISDCTELTDISNLNSIDNLKIISLSTLPNLEELNLSSLELVFFDIINVGIEDLSGFPKKILLKCQIHNCKTLKSLYGSQDSECYELNISSCDELNHLKFMPTKVYKLDISDTILKSLKGLNVSINTYFHDMLNKLKLNFPELSWSDIKFNFTRNDIEKIRKTLPEEIFYYICYLINNINDSELTKLKNLLNKNWTLGETFANTIKNDIGR